MQYEKCIESKGFKEPLNKINESRMIIDNHVKILGNLIKIKMINFETKLTNQMTKIDGLSPLKIMSRQLRNLKKIL